MAFVPDKPVRVREYLSDGTAHDVTVPVVQDEHQVLEGEEAVDINGTYLPAVHHTKAETKKLADAWASEKAEAEKAATAKEAQK